MLTSHRRTDGHSDCHRQTDRSPHGVDALRLLGEGVGVAAGGGAEVNGHHHHEGGA